MVNDNNFGIAIVKEEGNIRERAPWTRNERKKEMRLAKWRQKSWFDSTCREFALSRPRVRTNAELDAEWECKELLGRGSFGVVGLWTRSDSTGKVIDAIAIKQTEAEPREVNRRGETAVPWEVMIMSAIHARGCRNIVELRRTTFFPLERPMQWRFYMEVSEYGNMTDLVRYYQKERKRMPEAFIWQCFNDFAKVAVHMAHVRFDKSISPPGDDPFVLHLDLKHDNVLLGKPPPRNQGMNYPSVQVADWGLAEFTSTKSSENSRKWKGYGTAVWMPPEQRDYGQYGRTWKHNVLGSSNTPYTMKHVIWQMAACIYGLMNLHIHNYEIDKKLEHFGKNECRLREQGYSLIGTYSSSVYSKPLCKLVQDCLLVDPALRPSPRSFRDRTSLGWNVHYDKFCKNGFKNAEAMSFPRNLNLDLP